MKILQMILLSLFTCSGSALAETAVAVGDSYARVVEVLGRPSGEGRFDSMIMMSYPRGSVMLVSNAVTQVDLMDRAVWEAEQQAKREQAARRAQQAHESLQQLLADPGFQAADLEWRMQHWQLLQNRFPELSLPDAYRRDAQLWRQEVERNRREDLRFAELERRTLAAERAAQVARREAAEARREAESRRTRHVYGTTYITPPVVYGNGYNYGYGYGRRGHSSDSHNYVRRHPHSSDRQEQEPAQTHTSTPGGVTHQTVIQNLRPTNR